MKFIKTILSFTLLLTSFVAFAQPRSFSKKPAVYIQELNDYLATGASKKGAEIAEIFTMQWNDSLFGEVEQKIIINVSNGMLINDMTIADFELFQETILLGKDSVDLIKYQSWAKALRPALLSGNKTFLTLLTASRNLFKDNIIYQNETKTWFASNDNYVFNFEDKRVKIEFDEIDLTCQAQVDKLVIYETTGSYYLDLDEWEGSNGTISWERVGISKDNIYATIPGKYKLKLNLAELRVDTVEFMNEDFLNAPIMGSLRDRASSAKEISEVNLKKSDFPQFNSFQKNLELGSYLEGRVTFKGGYSMKGAEILAKGTAENPSIVEIKYKDKTRVVAKSEYFSMKEGEIKALAAEITLLTDSGYIYHPQASFNLQMDLKILYLTRGKKGLERAPFFDSDHQIEIKVDQIIWNLDLPKIDFDMASNESKAVVESAEFYKEIQYERIPRGMLAYHPLSKMRDYVLRNRTREFTFTEYAAWMNSRPTYLKPQIIDLADKGYLFYNIETDSIRVRKKLDHAVLSHLKLKDYDVIRFVSVIGARPNGYLNLENNTFVLEGVRAFRFSDSQSVYAFPKDQKVILKHKRRMSFGGKLTAGKFDFWGDEFNFDYYRFVISSDRIDSMRIYTEDFDGKNQLVAVKSVLSDINGVLEIDKSTNKSGLEDYPEYPIFTSKKGSVIAYNKPTLFNGAYKKEIFRFEVDPFTIDSLDNFTTAGLKFPGTFVSGGILPEFKYEAKIMDDYSLGFERANPPGGYTMYGGAGHGDIDIKLSEEGFTAKGAITYNGAEIKSENITMMPDSTLAAAESYVLREDDKYPQVLGRDVMTRWLPKSDSLFVNTNGHTITVLRDQQKFQGNIIQTSQQIAGNGVLSWERAKLTSKDMKYKPNRVLASTSQIEIGAIQNDKIAFASYNVDSDVDFDTRIGEFKANEKGKLTDFPFNAYASSMDEYKWDMDAETIELNKGPGLLAAKSYFISKNPAQQGLKFQSTKALFDMKEGVIYADEVPFIDVADSRVFPFEGDVVIKENADMQPLANSKMFANRNDKHHDIYEATIKIRGRYDLGGEGKYKYKDKHNTGQVFFLDKMRVVRGMEDSTVIASGFIKDSANFTVSPKIAYKGKVRLNSTQEHVAFNGYVKPLHSFEQYPSAWFRYNQQPDPSYVIIPAKKPMNEENRGLYAAVSIANDSTHVYPTFVNFKRSYPDLELTTDTGIMYYDEEARTFFVGDSMKLLEGERRGSYLAFNDADKSIFSEGKINFGLQRNERQGGKFEGITAGTVSKTAEDTAFQISTLLGLEFVLPEECYERMVQVLNTNGSGEIADNGSDFVYNAMSEFLNEKQLDRAFADVNPAGIVKPIGPFEQSTMIITKMDIAYSKYHKSFVSREPVHLGSIAGMQVNKVVDARVQIKKNRSTGRFTIYLEASKYDWFYFDYYMGTLYCSSTDLEFNTAIKTKGAKVSKGKYRVRAASPRTVSLFLKKLEPYEPAP